MLKVIIGEGARGVGKSTVMRLLREKIEGSTLINLTGFKEDGVNGSLKIQTYYYALHLYLKELQNNNHSYTVLFDRTFFSEMVYSPIYKDYDFTSYYKKLCEDLIEVADELEIYFFEIQDKDVLRQRLKRDKVKLFDQIEESVEQSSLQQALYQKLFDHFIDTYGHHNHVNVYKIDTSSLTPQEVRDFILTKE